MEVVEGDDEDGDEGEEKGRVAKMTAVSPMYCGKHMLKKTLLVLEIITVHLHVITALLHMFLQERDPGRRARTQKYQWNRNRMLQKDRVMFWLNMVRKQ